MILIISIPVTVALFGYRHQCLADCARIQRIGRHLERLGLLQRDVENDYLTENAFEADALTPLHSASITYRIALGPQRGGKFSRCRPC